MHIEDNAVMSKISAALVAIGLFVAANAQANPDGEQVFLPFMLDLP